MVGPELAFEGDLGRGKKKERWRYGLLPGQEPVTVEGASEMPGRGMPKERFGGGAIEVLMDYGKGTPTLVSHGAVAVPGMVAACGAASERFGQLSWRQVLRPAHELARDGFPLPIGAADFMAQTRQSEESMSLACSRYIFDAAKL